MTEQKMQLILNLYGELSESYLMLFQELGFQVVIRQECEDFSLVDVILVASEEQAQEVEQEFSLGQTLVPIICLGDVKNIKNFLISNGRVAVNPHLPESELGRYLLKKYFEKTASVHLDESFALFGKEVQSVKVINHLNVGSEVDRISLDAFEKGFNIVSLRSFLDHSIYYFTYLKQAGLAGIPYDVEYTSSEEEYVVSIHSSVKNFVAEYLMESFESVNSKKPFTFLLGVVANSCDYFEVTYLEDPGKVILTGLWTRGDKKGMTGVVFNNIKTTAQTLVQLDSRIKTYKGNEERIAENENKNQRLFSKKLPGGLVEMMMGEDPASSLYKNPEDTAKLVAIALANVEEYFPGKSDKDLTPEDLKKVLGDHGDPDLVNKLQGGDLDFLLDRVKNNKVEDSYYEEMERVRSKLKDDDDFKQVLGSTLTEEVAKRVAGHVDAETLNRILNGTPEDDEASTLVKGSKEEADNFVKAISSTEKDKNSPFVQIISNAFQKESPGFNVKVGSGGSPDTKGVFNFISNVVSSVDSLKNVDPSVKQYVKEKAPGIIQGKLKNFALAKGKDYQDLSEELLKEFNKTHVPSIVEDFLSNEDYIEEYKLELEQGKAKEQSEFDYSYKNKFEENLKKRLKEKLSSFESIYDPSGKFKITDDTISQESIQQAIKETMHETIKTVYVLENASREIIEKKEKEIVEDLASSLKREKGEVEMIVKGATEKVKEKEVEAVIENLFKESDAAESDRVDETKANTFEMEELIRKLKEAEEQNKTLERKVQALQIKNESSQKADEQLQQIKEQVAAASNQVPNDRAGSNVPAMTDEEVKDLVEKAKTSQLSEEEANKVAEKIQADQQVLAQAQENENLLRKLKVEAQQMDGVYKTELEKVNRALKAKELVVEQVKSNTKTLMLKKQAEIIDLKNKIKSLSNKLSDDSLTQMKNDLAQAQQSLKSLEKMNLIYKDKLEALSKGKNKNKDEVELSKLSEQVRTLGIAKSQLENRLKVEERKANTYLDRFNKVKESESKFRSQLTNAENLLKDYEHQIKSLKHTQLQQTKALESLQTEQKETSEIAQLNEQNVLLNNKVRELTEQLKEAEKAKEEAGKSSGSEGVATDSKTKTLEQGNKKLQQELAKAQGTIAEQKKDFMKQKSENTALKNQIQALKKEIDKLKAEAKKGKGGKKAA